MKITRVYYHVLGSCVFGFGLLLLVKLPNSKNTLLGDILFSLPAEGSNMAIRLGAPLLQAIGILLFLKWFHDQAKEKHVKIYKRYEPFILIFLVFFTPVILNAFIDSTIKAFVFAGKKNSEAVEYVKSKSSCAIEMSKELAKCMITVRNYNHSSQKVTLEINLDKLNKPQRIPVYLLRQQEKKVYVELHINHLKQQPVITKLQEQPKIIIN